MASSLDQCTHIITRENSLNQKDLEIVEKAGKQDWTLRCFHVPLYVFMNNEWYIRTCYEMQETNHITYSVYNVCTLMLPIWSLYLSLFTSIINFAVLYTCVV